VAISSAASGVAPAAAWLAVLSDGSAFGGRSSFA
jgi:hypothetical protein